MRPRTASTTANGAAASATAWPSTSAPCSCATSSLAREDVGSSITITRAPVPIAAAIWTSCSWPVERVPMRASGSTSAWMEAFSAVDCCVEPVLSPEAVYAACARVDVEIPGVDAARAKRFDTMLHACLYARTSTTVEGFLSFARELCDGMDREFPQG